MNRAELLRKALHFLALAIPILYLHLEDMFLRFFYPLAVLFLTLELSRSKIVLIKKWYLELFGSLLRPSEHEQPSGAFYFILGAAATILIFPKEIAVSALLVLIISDTAAALIGQHYGRRRIFHKTLAGSSAFFLTAWLILILYLGDNPFKHLSAAFLGTLVEALPWPLNDNLTIPLAVGFASWMML